MIQDIQSEVQKESFKLAVEQNISNEKNSKNLDQDQVLQGLYQNNSKLK
jgi:hypothetical protein